MHGAQRSERTAGRVTHNSAPPPPASTTDCGGLRPYASWCLLLVQMGDCALRTSADFSVPRPAFRQVRPRLPPAAAPPTVFAYGTGWTQQSRTCAQPSPARTDRDGWSRFQTTRTHRSAAFASMGAASVSRALSSDRAAAAAPWPGSIASVSTSGEDPPPTHAPSSAAITASSSTGSGARSSRTTGAVPP